MIFLSKSILIVSNSIDIVADTPNRITVLVFTVGPDCVWTCFVLPAGGGRGAAGM